MHVHEIVLGVGDVDEAVRFYTEVIGFRLVRLAEHDGHTVAELDGGGQRVSLVPTGKSGARVALGTDDLQAGHRLLRHSDATCDDEPISTDEGTWLGFRDPWGNELGLWEDREG